MPRKPGWCSAFFCCGRSSVHPDPRNDENDDQDNKQPEMQPKAQVAPPPAASKHPALLNCEDAMNDTCRYYCPLCMLYYEAVYETVCCGHTICDECALGYMRSASLRGPPNLQEPEPEEDWVTGDVITVTNNISTLLPNACPFCRETHAARDLPNEALEALSEREGFQLKLILPGVALALLRSYEDSPAGSTNQAPLPGVVHGVGPSPIRVGDSIEKLKAKMVPYERPPPVPSGVGAGRSRAPSGAATPREAAPQPPALAAVTPARSNEAVGAGVETPLGAARTGLASGVVDTPIGTVTMPARSHETPNQPVIAAAD